MKTIGKLSFLALLLTLTFVLTGCDEVIQTKIDNPVPQDVVNVVVANTGASPDEVTALISEAMSDAAVQAALTSGEPISVTVAGGSSTTGSNQTITIPMTTPGVGQNKVVVDLAFTGAITASEENPLEFKANSGADAGAADSDNQLNITMPDATGLVVTINLPKTTVVLTTSGTGTVYKTVNSKTAMETLVISEGVTVEELLIADGTVIVKDGGKVESYVYQPSSNEEKLIILPDGSVEPQKVYVGNEEKFELRKENGDPYYASNLKVKKSEADYAKIFFTQANPSSNPLKTVTICDGAVLKTNWIAMETIEGQGTAEINFRKEFDFIAPSFTTDEDPFTSEITAKYYQYQCDLSHVKSIKNIVFSQPEIILSQANQELVTQKENEGFVQRPTMLNLDVDEKVENCVFNYDYVHFCPWLSYPLVKGCKFVPTDAAFDNKMVEISMLDPRGNAFDANSLYSMSFDGCEFGNGMKFKVTYGTTNTGTIDFTDCKYNGQSMDNLELLNQIIVGQVIISINGVPKYSTSYDTEAPTKWKVTAIE